MNIKKVNEMLSDDDFINHDRESFFTTGKRIIQRDFLGTYPESAFIHISIYDDKSAFIQNDGTNKVSLEINKMLDKLNIIDFIKRNDRYIGSTNTFDPSDFEKISDYLISIGCKRVDNVSRQKYYIFSIKTTLKDLKNKKANF